MRTLIYILILSTAALLVITSAFPGSSSVRSFLSTGTDNVASALWTEGGKSAAHDRQAANAQGYPVRPPVINGTFDDGVTGWNFYTDSIGSFTIASTTSGNVGKIITSKIGNNVQFYQQGIGLRPNAHYRLTFKARSSSAHGFSVSLFKQDEQTKNYGLSETYFGLSTTTESYFVEFTTAGFDAPVSDARLMFWLAPYAGIGDEYWLDDISLDDLDAPATLATGGQSSGSSAKPPVEAAATAADPRTSIPIITPNGGTYPDTVEVSISSRPGSVIYYTLDGSLPTRNSNVYSGPLSISTTSILSAIAGQDGSPDTAVATSSFVIDKNGGRNLSNGSFESGMDEWNFITTGYAVFAPKASDRSSRSGYMLVSEAGSMTALFQKGIILEPNTPYSLSFAARSTAGHDLSVSVFQDGTPEKSYGLADTPVTLTPEWKNYSLTFTTEGLDASVQDARMQFTLTPYAAYGDEYWLDDITLRKTSP